MNKPAYSEVEESHRQIVRNFELAAVMGVGNGFLPVYLAFAVAALLIIHPGVSQATSALWATFYLVYIAIRTIATSLYNDDIDHSLPDNVTQWRRFVLVSAFAHGAILGSLALIALPGLSPARQLVLTCFVLLVTTGAVVYVSAVLPALLVLISTALLPFVYAWEARPDALEIHVGWFLLVAWALNVLMSYIHHRAGSQFFLLAASNQTLVDDMEQKNRELEAADRARVQLLAVTSHDLKQPVHAMRLVLAHFDEHEDVEVIKKNLDKLREISNLIAQMLMELMDLSTLEQQLPAKRLEAISLTTILRQLETSQEPIARRKGLGFDIQSDEDIWVRADASLLRRMLLNLISNAIKYTAAGGVRIECNVQYDNVVISVCDSGIGIPASRLDDIFHPYVRLESLITEKDGVGLGLAIVHRAAVIQGIDVHVASTVGVGSIFEVNVPLAEKRRETGDSDTRMPYSEPLPDTLIAVVDDDFYAREALVALLERWGYDTASGETLMDLKAVLNEERKPSLVIADNHLSPIEFGPDVILELRNIYKDPLMMGIVMTGDPNVVLNDLPHVRLVNKPLDPVFLRSLVSQMTVKGKDQFFTR